VSNCPRDTGHRDSPADLPEPSPTVAIPDDQTILAAANIDTLWAYTRASPSHPDRVSDPVNPTVTMMVFLLGGLLFAPFGANWDLVFSIPFWSLVLVATTVVVAPPKSRSIELSPWKYVIGSVGLGGLHVGIALVGSGVPGALVVLVAIGLMNAYWLLYARRHLA